MIQLKNLCAGYPGRDVLHGITLDLLPGEVLVLLGPNGSGKSTLLKAVLGLLIPTAGEILCDGSDMTRMRRKEIARKAAFLTQNRNIPAISARKMVLHGRFPYLSYPRTYSPRDHQAVDRAMDITGTRQFAQEHLPQLSGGQRQGVYLAATLAQETQTILMDEPTTYLDMNRQLQLIRTARELADAGRAVVLVLHDLSLALRFAHRVALLEDGRLRICDTPEKVYESGLLDAVFGVRVHAVTTSHGTQYYCTQQEE